MSSYELSDLDLRLPERSIALLEVGDTTVPVVVVVGFRVGVEGGFLDLVDLTVLVNDDDSRMVFRDSH